MAFLRNTNTSPAKSWGIGSALLLALAASGCTQNPPVPEPIISAPVVPELTNATDQPFTNYRQLAWSDEFSAASLDATKWKPEVKDVWYNNELQATTNDRKNLTLNGGNLQITAVKENYNGRTYTSARIVTKGLKDFNFGRIDTRAKLPKGKGVWPAIWMLGSNDSQASWPACGEIDIMELKGSQPQVNYSTIHFGASISSKRDQGTAYSLPMPAPPLPAGDFSTDFHVFSVIRSQNKIRWYVDSTLYYTRTQADVAPSPYPFNNPFYMILNVAVGGDFDGNPNASTVFPQQMLVDYVRYYKYKE